MSLLDKAEKIVMQAEEVAKAPMLQQVGKIKTLLPELAQFVKDVAKADEQRRIEAENVRLELRQLKQKLGGVIGFDARGA
jgi:hypothetical protein